MEQVIRDYQRENSDLTTEEIRTALLHSTEGYEDEGALTGRRLRAILAVVAAAVIAGVAVMTESGARGGGGSGSAGIMWKVVAGVLVALAIVFVVRNVNRR